MTTHPVPFGVARLAATGRTRAFDLALAGSLLAVAGGVILMGIITAEALYPAPYATGANEISDLGGTRPPAGIVLQPSAAIFDLSMIVVGLLLAASAVFVHRAYGFRSVSLPIGVLGLAALGVGIFPGNTGAPHAICAMVTFVAGGIAAVTSARVVSGPFRPARDPAGDDHPGRPAHLPVPRRRAPDGVTGGGRDRALDRLPGGDLDHRVRRLPGRTRACGRGVTGHSTRPYWRAGRIV